MEASLQADGFGIAIGYVTEKPCFFSAGNAPVGVAEPPSEGTTHQ